MSLRNIDIVNRIDESEWMSKNRATMDIELEYAQEIEADRKVLSAINQVRMRKKMILLQELVRFFRIRKTREVREEKTLSYVQ